VTEAALPTIFGAVGAALVVVAAVVFAYSGLVDNPGVPRGVLTVLTALAATTTLVLRRRGFAASAEAVGAMTTALGLIAVHLLTSAAPEPGRQVLLALASLGWAAGLVGAGRWLALRAWWGGGLAVVPVAVAVLAWADVATKPELRAAVVLTCSTATVAGCAWLERRWRTSRRRHTVESVVLTAEAVVAGFVASVMALVCGVHGSGHGLGGALVLIGLGCVGVALGRARPGAWTWIAGMYLVGGVAWTVPVVAAASRDGLSVLGAMTTSALLAWVALSVVALAVAPGRFSSLLAGGQLITVMLVAGLTMTTTTAVVAAVDAPFTSGSLALANPDWTNPWLPITWLVVAVAWVWYAALPVAVRAKPRTGTCVWITNPDPGLAPWPRGRADAPVGEPVDPDDVRVAVRGPVGDVEVPFTVWTQTAPSPGFRLAAARLASTNELVPLAQLDDPWYRPVARLGRLLGPLAPVAAAGAVGTLGLLPGTPLWASLTIWLVGGALAWAGERVLPGRTTPAAGPRPSFARVTLRPGLWVAGLGLVAFAAQLSWWSHPAALVTGVAVVALMAAWTSSARPSARPWLVACGYGYALVVAAAALAWYPPGWDPGWPATFGALAVVSAVVAVVVGRAHQLVGHTVYFTVLGVGAVPWGLAVATMFAQRTWWAAAACAAVLGVEAAVLSSRRRPQPVLVRLVATVGLVPTAAAVAVNVGPQLTSQSGAPAVLVVVALLAGVGALAAGPWARRLVAGQMDRLLASRIRAALELSALGTVLVAELLALVRESAGGVVSLRVCAVAGLAASYLATRPDRRHVWWVAWLAWSGLLWSALAMAGVGLVEAYTAPPTLVAAVIGFWFMPRARALVHLGGVATLVTLVPTLALTLGGHGVLVRTVVLAGAGLFLGVVAVLVRNTARATVLGYTAGGIAAAGAGPFVLATHTLGVARHHTLAGSDPWFDGTVSAWTPSAQFFAVLWCALVAAAFMALAGVVLGWTSQVGRWRLAGALVVVATGTLLATCALPHATLVPLVVAWLVGAVLVAGGAAGLRRARTVPPAWVWWPAAYLTFVVPWVTGAAVVEWYALPFGAAMVASGWVVVQRTPRRATAVLAPAAVAVLGPSTATLLADPATWRAIMLVLLALAFMLAGARKMWKALLALGIADMGLVVVVVFATAGVSPTPWFITLLATGGLLLTLGVYVESRRTATR